MGSILKPYKPKPRYIPKRIKHEQSMQLRCINYIRKRQPFFIFRSDYSSGLKLTMAQATMHKRLQSSRSWPDLAIYEPFSVTVADGSTVNYCGMALELKKDRTPVFMKIGPRKGKISTDPHIQEQYLMLKELKKTGVVC
jgi:hypothetical protein